MKAACLILLFACHNYQVFPTANLKANGGQIKVIHGETLVDGVKCLSELVVGPDEQGKFVKLKYSIKEIRFFRKNLCINDN